MKAVFRLGHLISVGILTFSTREVVAGWFGADFSAMTYEQSPDYGAAEGRMYVSDGKVRTEMSVKGRTMVEIIDPHKGLAWLLDTSSKTYRERIVPKQAEHLSDDNPCQGEIAAKCQLLGSELLNGRLADKWRLNIKQQQQLLWLDTTYHFPVQVMMDGNTVFAMRYLGKETIGARVVEKWEANEKTPQGELRSLQWYDPELNIAIRQQAANGAVRALKNIRLGKQPDALFVVPEAYQRAVPR